MAHLASRASVVGRESRDAMDRWDHRAHRESEDLKVNRDSEDPSDPVVNPAKLAVQDNLVIKSHILRCRHLVCSFRFV